MAMAVGTRRASWLLVLLLLGGVGTSLVLASEAWAQDEVDPAAEEALFTGVALLEAGDAAGAIAKFDQALRIQKDLRRVLFYRARAWVRLGDVAEARKDADAYAAYSLSASEQGQLAELRTEIDEREAQVGEATTRPDPDRLPSDDGRIEDAGPDGFALLRAAEEALARGDCAVAGDKAQEALSVDNTLTRAFLVKGLALECEGELERAQDLIGTYQEMRGDRSADPVATAALERLSKAIRGEDTSEPTGIDVGFEVLGTDDTIRGVLGQDWGMPQERALEVRTRRHVLQNVGAADVGRPRMTIGGSNARVERAWVVDQKGMLWSRLRVYERQGLETADWFVRSFSELYRTIERDTGQSGELQGIEGPIEDGEGARRALRGLQEFSAEWTDKDGDTVRLRLGRCTVTGDTNKVHPDTAPCLEVVGWSGQWTPGQGSIHAKAGESATRGETPGRLAPDFAGGLGIGFGPSVWAPGIGGAAFGGEFGLDVNLRFALGGFVVGAGWAVSVTGYTNFNDVESGAFADNRIMFYVGGRDRPRQRVMTDIMVGVGFVPELAGAAPAVALRILTQVRIGAVTRFFVSWEPYAAIGTDVSIVPIRFSLGLLFGTKMRGVKTATTVRTATNQ
jgi:tetratricopeptide (TPR) repeat protein